MRRNAISTAVQEEESEINITPMLDVVFIMLIFGNPAALLSTSQAVLRKSFMVAARGDGSGTLHYQQVQHT